jgi:ABC-2 type transport system permease protein
MGVINNAYANAATSLFMSRSDRSIENVLVSPISFLRIVTAMVIGGMIRGLLVGGITLIVAIPLTGLNIASIPWTLLMMVTVSIFFASFGVLTGLWAESWDHLATVANFVIIPFVYLGGVFYSISMLPPTWQRISSVNPLFYMIDSLRWAILGRGDVAVAFSFAMTAILALLTFSIAVYLFKKGYKLIV